MKDNRPVNLNLFVFKWPLAALASITHRVSGVILFIGTGGLLYLLDLSLQSPAGFALVETILEGAVAKFVIWAILSALAYHFIAGLKHLILDFGFGESKAGARTGALVTMATAAVVIVLLGVWIW